MLTCARSAPLPLPSNIYFYRQKHWKYFLLFSRMRLFCTVLSHYVQTYSVVLEHLSDFWQKLLSIDRSLHPRLCVCITQSPTKSYQFLYYLCRSRFKSKLLFSIPTQSNPTIRFLNKYAMCSSNFSLYHYGLLHTRCAKIGRTMAAITFGF